MRSASGEFKVVVLGTILLKNLRKT